jgi:hypothetical protein
MPNVVLHMGFLNVPYSAKSMAAPMRAAKSEASRKQRRGFTKTMTAEAVANILEEKYNILETFSELNQEEIMQPINEAFNNAAVELLSERRKFTSERMAKYMKPKTDRIEKLFRQFLDMEEMSGRSGIPTQAALSGKGRRSHKPGKSFIDTGIYRAAFTAWVDIK